MEYPVQKELSCQNYKGIDIYRIIDASGCTIATGLTEKTADYIVQVINSHEKLVEALKPAKKAIISLHCNYEGTRAPHDGRVPGCKLCADLEIIKQALKETEKPK